jgi:hypothetical protein
VAKACKGNETELRVFGFIISRLKSQEGYLESRILACTIILEHSVNLESN